MQTFRFLTKIESKYLIFASLPPTKDRPPKGILVWINHCEQINRPDLATLIRQRWENVFDRAPAEFPTLRYNYATAQEIAARSIKKNIFLGSDFSTWLAKNETITPEKQNELKKDNVLTLPPGTPKIAIPAPAETVEQFLSEAEKTKKSIEMAEEAFTNADEFFVFLNTEIKEIEDKIDRYSGAKTKTGKPSKMEERIPKWKEQISLYNIKLNEVKAKMASASKNLEAGKKAYNVAPVTTVAFEKKVQDKIMELTLRLGQLEAERESVVSELQSLAKQLTRVEASFSVTAGFFDVLLKIFDSLKKIWSKLSRTGDAVLDSSQEFVDLANLQGLELVA
jgi:hypothetical protein